MKQFVVDASVIMAYFIADEQTTYAKGFFNSLEDEDEIIIPEFCLVECTNVIWKQVRFHSMAQDTANQFLDELRKLPVTLTVVESLLPQALQIGVKHQLAIYDSIYVSLAKDRSLPLITVDEPQRRAAIGVGVTLIPLTNFVP